MFIRDKIPANSIKHIKLTDSMECILSEINVGKKKWVLISTYRPASHFEKFFFN